MSVSIVTFANLGRKVNLPTADILPVINELDRNGDLKQVICQVNKGFFFKNTQSAIPAIVRYPLRIFGMFFGFFISRKLTERFFDFFAQRKIQ